MKVYNLILVFIIGALTAIICSAITNYSLTNPEILKSDWFWPAFGAAILIFAFCAYIIKTTKINEA